MRICLVYDCLYPHTVGGAERWYRNLGEHLAAAGHEVTYLTLRQWERGEDPGVPGVRVVPVGPRMQLYAGRRRRILPPLVFGLGVLRHLLRHGRRYDVVHTASFPYFSLLAAAATRPVGRFSIVVDWHEVWTLGYWREYLGPLGRVGWLVQRICAAVPQRAFCFSRLHAARLGREVTVLGGQYVARGERPSVEASSPPVAVFAARLIPEKRAPAAVEAIARARERLPELRGLVLGDGPERPELEAAIARHGVDDVVEAPGFVASERVDRELASAACMVLPSRREGYGMVVLEAAARATPSVVVAHPDNAAVELVADGENGFVAGSEAELADAIVRCVEAGAALRESTAAWYSRNAERLSLARSLETVEAAYRS